MYLISSLPIIYNMIKISHVACLCSFWVFKYLVFIWLRSRYIIMSKYTSLWLPREIFILFISFQYIREINFLQFGSKLSTISSSIFSSLGQTTRKMKKLKQSNVKSISKNRIKTRLNEPKNNWNIFIQNWSI